VSRSDGGGITISRRTDKKERAYAKHNRKNMPVAEVILWEKLRRKQLGVSFRRQHPVKPFIADFACIAHKLIIECDGDSHEETQNYDQKRDNYLQGQGWRVVRFLNGEIYDALDEVVDRIKLEINRGE